MDSAGNLYVADTYNSTIRKITNFAGVVTLAGLAGNVGSTNGTGSTARFNYPFGVAVDAGGNVYVADTYNSTIRKITANGAVSIVAGLAGNSGSADGTNGNARFNLPQGIAVDINSNIFVADTGNDTIREITPIGTNWVGKHSGRVGRKCGGCGWRWHQRTIQLSDRVGGGWCGQCLCGGPGQQRNSGDRVQRNGQHVGWDRWHWERGRHGDQRAILGSVRESLWTARAIFM